MVKRLAGAMALAFLLVAALLSAVPASGAPARRDLSDRLAVSGTDRIGKLGVPRQPSRAQAATIAAAAATTESQCIDSEDVLVLTIPSFDPAHPGTQDVVFHRETPADAPGRARIWVAWDFLATDWGPPDEIGCDQVEYLQGAADEIIDTDVHYFGDYLARGDGGKNVDILTYNIVDELYYDPTFESFTAGFYSSQFQEEFDRNIFFLDSLDLVVRPGPGRGAAVRRRGHVRARARAPDHERPRRRRGVLDRRRARRPGDLPQRVRAPGGPRDVLPRVPPQLADRLAEPRSRTTGRPTCSSCTCSRTSGTRRAACGTTAGPGRCSTSRRTGSRASKPAPAGRCRTCTTPGSWRTCRTRRT